MNRCMRSPYKINLPNDSLYWPSEMKAFFITYLVGFIALLPLSSNAQKGKGKMDIESLKAKAMEHYYYNKDSAYFYFDKTYDLAQKQKNLKARIESLFNSTGVASYHYDLSRMGSNLNELDTLVHKASDSVSKASAEDQNIFLYYLGDYQLKLFENANSRKSFQTIIENSKKTPDSLMTNTMRSLSSAAHSFLGKIYLLEGKYDLAEQLYRRNIRSIENEEKTNLEGLYGNYNLLAEVLMKEGSYKEANSYLLKTFRYHREQKEVNSIVTGAFNIAENYNHLGNKDSALFYLEKAKSNFENKPLFYPKYHIKKAMVYKTDGEFDNALKNFRKALQIIDREFLNQKNSDLPIAINEIGKIQALSQEPEEALSNFNEAIKKAEGNSKNNRFCIEVLKNKAKLLNRMANTASYASALEAVLQGSQILDSLKPTFKSHTDKLFLLEDAYPLFEVGIEATFNLFKTEGDENAINSAFELMEKSKSILLLEALLASKATNFSNIPKQLVERESQLKSEITFTEKIVNTTEPDTGKLKDDLFDLKTEYRQLIHTIETNYKNYYDLKYNMAIASLKEMQKKLGPNEKLISYFFGNEAIYAISIAKNEKQLEKIPIDDVFEKTISKIHGMLADPKSDIRVLGKATHELYRKLLESLIEPNTTKLTIIADGPLKYIPFSALNTASQGLSYMGEQCAISYSNSATLLLQLRQRPPKLPKVLAFAPSFDGKAEVNIKRSSLLPLPHNKSEVSKVLSAFEGRSLINEEASLQNFKKEFQKYGILHVASHAIFNDSTPEYSYLAFSQNELDNNEDLLFVADLYNIKTDADLITLSACETGIGELRRGEGFMGLSRGFFYGGAASIASTLWKINDASSADLMGAFYKNLSKGDTKDEALQKAQKDFLKTNAQNALAHPYYWSGFIVSGNTAPLKTPRPWLWILVLGSIAVVGTGGILYKKFKKAA